MEPFIGYITLVGFNFAPVGWAFCNGQLLPIAQYPALYSLIGTTYGGDGVNTFALPDLRGRAPIHMGQGGGLSSYVIGEVTGSESVTLNSNQLPSHVHNPLAGAAGTAASPANAIWANTTNGDKIYLTTGTPASVMAGQPFVGGGGNQPHENRQPFLALNYVIALEGIFPTRN
jgi:microcystin-dependent protein